MRLELREHGIKAGKQPRLDHQLCAIQIQKTRAQRFELRRVGLGKADAHHRGGAFGDARADAFERDRRQLPLRAQCIECARQVRCRIEQRAIQIEQHGRERSGRDHAVSASNRKCAR